VLLKLDGNQEDRPYFRFFKEKAPVRLTLTSEKNKLSI